MSVSLCVGSREFKFYFNTCLSRSQKEHCYYAGLFLCITAGLNLAVFRDERGVAHALDAYCPHMGANLGAGGRVKGNCLECPFHAWRFRGDDGKCTHIPYTDKSEYQVRPNDLFLCLGLCLHVYIVLHVMHRSKNNISFSTFTLGIQPAKVLFTWASLHQFLINFCQ